MLAIFTTITASTVVLAVPNGNATVTNNSVNGDYFWIRFGNTSVRHNPSIGIRGTAARLNNANARFHLTGDARIDNGGFTWRLGFIQAYGVAGRPWDWTTQVTADNGFNYTNVNGRLMWIATSQLTAVSGTPAAQCN